MSSTLLWIGLALFIVGLVVIITGFGGACYGVNYMTPSDGSIPPQPSSQFPLFYSDCTHHGIALIPLVALIAGLVCMVTVLARGNLKLSRYATD